MPEMHLTLTKFTYNACDPCTKEKYKKSETENLQ